MSLIWFACQQLIDLVETCSIANRAKRVVQSNSSRRSILDDRFFFRCPSFGFSSPRHSTNFEKVEMRRAHLSIYQLIIVIGFFPPASAAIEKSNGQADKKVDISMSIDSIVSIFFQSNRHSVDPIENGSKEEKKPANRHRTRLRSAQKWKCLRKKNSIWMI